jgi:DNA recombination protein RmuC
VKKKLDEASSKIEETGRRTRVLTRKLRDVEALPLDESRRLLGEAEAAEDGVES